MSVRQSMDLLLRHLRLDREPPTLPVLHRIIREHQQRVPFETLTKLIDYESGLQRGDFMPPLALNVDRIVTRGAGVFGADPTLHTEAAAVHRRYMRPASPAPGGAAESSSSVSPASSSQT